MKILYAETAKAFNNEDDIDVSEYTSIGKEAAKILCNYKQDLNFSSLEYLTDQSLEALSGHSGNLILPEHLLFNDYISDFLDGKAGLINGDKKSKFANDNLLKLKKIKYKKLSEENYKELINNGINFTSMSNDGAVALSTDQGIECIRKAAEVFDKSFESLSVISFGQSLQYQGPSVFRTPNLDVGGALSLYKINKIYNFDHTVEARILNLLRSQDNVAFNKLDESAFILWTQGEHYCIREIKDISVGAAKLVANYEGDTGYGSLEFQGFYFDELEALSTEAKTFLELSYHKVRLPQQFTEAMPQRLDLTTQAAEAYVNSKNAEILKAYTHLCDESAARCLTYFKDVDIVMGGLRVMSTDCAASLGFFHKQNLQIESIAKISPQGLAELSKKQGTINGLNPRKWCVENSCLAATQT